jgi:hypothetical protein
VQARKQAQCQCLSIGHGVLRAKSPLRGKGCPRSANKIQYYSLSWPGVRKKGALSVRKKRGRSYRLADAYGIRILPLGYPPLTWGPRGIWG